MIEVGRWGPWCLESLVGRLGKWVKEQRKCIYLSLHLLGTEWGKWELESATLDE